MSFSDVHAVADLARDDYHYCYIVARRPQEFHSLENHQSVLVDSTSPERRKRSELDLDVLSIRPYRHAGDLGCGNPEKDRSNIKR